MPTDLPPLIRDQRKVDADHLKLLAIFHFVYAGMAGLGLLFVAGHFAMFKMISSPKFLAAQQPPPTPPPEFFAMLKWVYLIGGTWFVLGMALNVISGLCIRAKQHRRFSLVVAVMNCVRLGTGTVLGVFTMIVLVRDSVRELYDARTAPRLAQPTAERRGT